MWVSGTDKERTLNHKQSSHYYESGHFKYELRLYLQFLSDCACWIKGSSQNWSRWYHQWWPYHLTESLVWTENTGSSCDCAMLTAEGICIFSFCWSRDPKVTMGFRGQQHQTFHRLWREDPRWFHFHLFSPTVVGSDGLQDSCPTPMCTHLALVIQ